MSRIQDEFDHCNGGFAFLEPALFVDWGMHRFQTKTRAALVACLVLSACHGATAPPPAPAPAQPAVDPASVIDAARLREHVARLSSDELAGRGPGTEGDRRTRSYLAEQLDALGAAPGAGASWQQPLELVGITSVLPKAWTFARGGKRLSLSWWEQYIAGSGVQAARGSIDAAEVVFVGYGIEAPEYGWDDFKGHDVRGKVLLMLNNDPDWDPALFAGNTRLYYGRWTYKYESAARHGAVGAIIVHTQASAGYPFQVVQSSWGGQQFSLPSTEASSLQLKAWVTESAAAALVELAGKQLGDLQGAAHDKAFAPVPLGITTSLRFENQVERVATANVFGVIPGSDPELRDEYVVLSAHHDHLGTGKPDAAGDAIYNGALDNAAGVAQVLGLAAGLAQAPPRRSVLVLFPAAEEAGLLGSQFFAAHPPVPASKIAANVNFDGGNIWGRTRDITQIGRGKSSIDDVLDRLVAREGREVRADQFPDRGSFYRSDQFSFAKIGVPALYLKTGTEVIGRPEGWGKEQILAFEAQRYHQPSDQLDAGWTFDGMVDDARLAFRVAAELANSDELPRWRAGDEFEAVRRASLDAAVAAPASGAWDARVSVNGVDIPFRFELFVHGARADGAFFNGDERVASTGGEFAGGVLSLEFGHYASRLTATWADDRLEGSYERPNAKYAFSARPHVPELVPTARAPAIDGDWDIAVNSPKGESAWRLFVRQSGPRVTASILRVDGDTGTLDGSYRDGKFSLSHFSGARPLLLELTPTGDDALSIVENGKTQYTALRSAVARARRLPEPADPASWTAVRDASEPLRFTGKTLKGAVVTSSDRRFAGKVVVLDVMGSWCPNCHDEAPFLAELDRKFRGRGLEVVSLSFEDAEQLANPARLRAFIERYGIEHTVLLAGEPSELAQKLPQAVNLNTWPATFFIGRDGRVRSVHAGFAGKATGAAHERLRTEVTTTVERLLAEKEPSGNRTSSIAR